MVRIKAGNFSRLTSGWVTFLLVIGLIMSGCATKAQSGAGIGAVVGAALGSQFGPAENRKESALMGAAIGALLGYAVGNEMDKYDTAQLNQAFETGKSNTATTWVNPDTKNKYTVTPKPAVTDKAGRPCRDASIEAIIDGQPQTVVTRACRTPEGVWELQS